jgi:hypothetical protein
MPTKFSQFNPGGAPIAGDIIVGLRNGLDTQFIFSGLPTLSWLTISASQTLSPDVGYFITSVIPTNYALPTVIAVGQIIQIVNISPSTFTLTQSAGQFIEIGGAISTVGVAGSATSNASGDSITLVCSVANIAFTALNGVGGIWTVT